MSESFTPSPDEVGQPTENPTDNLYQQKLREIQGPLSRILPEDATITTPTGQKSNLVSVNLVEKVNDKFQYYEPDSQRDHFPTGVALDFPEVSLVIEALSVKYDAYQYSAVLEQLYNVPQRQLDSDRKDQLVKNLDERRKEIHNSAADSIAENLKKSAPTLEISASAARKIFESLYYIGNANPEALIEYKGFMLMQSELREDEDEGLIAEIREKFGQEVSIEHTYGGFHNISDGDIVEPYGVAAREAFDQHIEVIEHDVSIDFKSPGFLIKKDEIKDFLMKRLSLMESQIIETE